MQGITPLEKQFQFSQEGIIQVLDFPDNPSNVNYLISGGRGNITSLKMLSNPKVKFFPPHSHLTPGNETQLRACLHSLQPGYMCDSCIIAVDYQSVKIDLSKQNMKMLKNSGCWRI